jgi:hypothetical protein
MTRMLRRIALTPNGALNSLAPTLLSATLTMACSPDGARDAAYGAAMQAQAQRASSSATPNIRPPGDSGAKRAAQPAAPLPMADATSVETGPTGKNDEYKGVPFLGADGRLRFGEVPCPVHPAELCWQHLVRQGDPPIHNGYRSEITYTPAQYNIRNGGDYWIAFAIWIPDTWPLQRKFGDRSSFFQVHQRSDRGDKENSVPLALYQQEDGMLRWLITSSPLKVSSDADTVRTEIHSEPMHTKVWLRYIVHYRPQFDASKSPLVEIWRDESLIAATRIPNAFDNDAPAWAKFGIYKWSDLWTASELTFYSMGIFFGEGENLLEAARLALR